MAKSKTPEGAIKQEICEWLESLGVFFWVQESVGIYDPVRRCFRKKNSRFQRKGVSDILGIHDGQFFALEVKTPRRYPSPEQRLFMQDVDEHGGVAFVVRSVKEAKEKLTPYIKPSPSMECV